ncbi:MAG: TolC family protein [Selenomonadaceae bacterium]|nr:TolC family protein [Selenomonadaceae bacterium]
MRIFSVALIAAIVFTCAANAEDNLTITLEEAIALALENNRLIEQAQEDRESARLELSAARKNFGPTLSWNSSSMRIGGRNYHQERENRYRYRAMDKETRRERDINLADYPPYKSSNANSVTLSIPIYTGGQLEGQIKSADFGLNSADLILENTRQEVKFQTAQAYYNVLQCKNLMKVRQEALNNLNEHLRVVQIQYDVGNVAMADVIETKVQIADSRQGLNTVLGDYENAMATLRACW